MSPSIVRLGSPKKRGGIVVGVVGRGGVGVEQQRGWAVRSRSRRCRSVRFRAASGGRVGARVRRRAWWSSVGDGGGCGDWCRGRRASALCRGSSAAWRLTVAGACRDRRRGRGGGRRGRRRGGGTGRPSPRSAAWAGLSARHRPPRRRPARARRCTATIARRAPAGARSRLPGRRRRTAGTIPGPTPSAAPQFGQARARSQPAARPDGRRLLVGLRLGSGRRLLVVDIRAVSGGLAASQPARTVPDSRARRALSSAAGARRGRSRGRWGAAARRAPAASSSG